MKRIKHIIEYLLLRTAFPLLYAIPYRPRRMIGSALGLAVFRCYAKRRRIALDNIARSFPEKDTAWHLELCRQSFRHLGMNAMEFVELARMDARFMDRYFTIEGEEHFIEALALGKGLVAICPHLGNWEFIAACFGLKGYPVSVIMKRQSNPYTNRMIEKFRRRFDMGLIYKSSAGFAVLRGLKQNRIIGIVADQDAGDNGLFVDFFGRPASTAQGPARFAAACQSPAVLIAGIREQAGRFRIIITPPLPFTFDPHDPGKSALENTKIWVAATERLIRDHPEQYFWVHNRWKTVKPASPTGCC